MSVLSYPQMPDWPLWWNGSRVMTVEDLGVVKGGVYSTRVGDKAYVVHVGVVRPKVISVYYLIYQDDSTQIVETHQEKINGDPVPLMEKIMNNLPSYLMRWAL